MNQLNLENLSLTLETPLVNSVRYLILVTPPQSSVFSRATPESPERLMYPTARPEESYSKD